MFIPLEFADADAPESIANILARYAELEGLFPEELAGAALPYFVDWLTENVHLVEITVYSDDDAYTIFETMNDRGLSLTPAELRQRLDAETESFTSNDRFRLHGMNGRQIHRLLELRQQTHHARPGQTRQHHGNVALTQFLQLLRKPIGLRSPIEVYIAQRFQRS